jgi:hypothetical protein
MLNYEIKNLLKTVANYIETPYRIYTGIDINLLTPLLNEDGNYPYVRKVTAREDKLLALDANYFLKSEIYRVTIVGDKPNLSSQYWLSSDNGTTKTRVKVMFEQSRVCNTHNWLFLEKQGS